MGIKGREKKKRKKERKKKKGILPIRLRNDIIQINSGTRKKKKHPNHQSIKKHTEANYQSE